MELKGKFRSLIQSTAAHYAINPGKHRSLLAGAPSLMGPYDAMCPVTRHMVGAAHKRIREVAAKWCKTKGRTADELTEAIRGRESWIMHKFVLLQGILDVPEYLGMGELPKLLKAPYRDIPVELWQDLQKLHDTELFWKGRTHSPGGKAFVKFLLRKWSDPKLLKKYVVT